MSLQEIANMIKLALGSRCVVRKQPPSGQEEWYIIEDRERDERIIEIEGVYHSFAVKVHKTVDPELRKRLFGWYVSLFPKQRQTVNIQIKGNAYTRLYTTDDDHLVGEYTLDGPFYYLYVENPLTTRANAIELIKQMTYELTNEGH